MRYLQLEPTTEQDERIRERIAKFLRRSLVANRLQANDLDIFNAQNLADAATEWLALQLDNRLNSSELDHQKEALNAVLEGVYPCPLVLFLQILHILGSPGIASDNLINLMDDISEICSEK